MIFVDLKKSKDKKLVSCKDYRSKTRLLCDVLSSMFNKNFRGAFGKVERGDVCALRSAHAAVGPTPPSAPRTPPLYAHHVTFAFAAPFGTLSSRGQQATCAS